MAYVLPEVITEEELKKVLEKTDHMHHRLAFALGFYECMRISEIVNLRPEHVDMKTRIIRIIQGKGHKDRNIPIAPEVVRGVKFLPVGVGVRALEMAFKKKAKEALGKDLHFHLLRHSGVTHYLVKKKWDAFTVQRFAGHSRVTTTQIYAHVSPQDLVNRMWEK